MSRYFLGDIMKKICYFSALIMLFSSMLVFAQDLNMHDSPDEHSKVNSKIDPRYGIIVIYQPENSAWVKIANPKNGDVGWIKHTELNQNKMVEYSIVKHIVTNDQNFVSAQSITEDLENLSQWQQRWVTSLPVFMPLMIMQPPVPAKAAQ